MSRLVGHHFVHYVESSSVASLSRSPSPAADLDMEALRALDFFHHSTARELDRAFATQLWSKALSCFMQQQPAIRNGVVALASFHENFVRSSRAVFGHQRKVTALEHYSKSIHGIVQLNQDRSENAVMTTLISSLLYCAIESMQGHLVSAMKHIRAGLALLAEQESFLLEQEDKHGAVLPGFVHTLRRLFVGLGTQLLGMEDSFIEPSLLTFLQSPEESVRYHFETVDDALVNLAYLLNDAMRFMAWAEQSQVDPDFPNQAQWLQGERLQQRFDQWTSAYHDLLVMASTARSTNSNDSRSAYLILRINQLFLKIVLAVKYERNQNSLDNFVDDFRVLIETAEDFFESEADSPGSYSSDSGYTSASSKPAFSLSLGVIPAIFFTSGRCRDTDIRHRALSLLKNNRRREAIWDCQLVARVAERVILIEEERAQQHWNVTGSLDGLRPMQKDMVRLTVQGVPDVVRVHTLTVNFLGGDRNEAEISMTNLDGVKQHIEHYTWDE